jgi:hypothetical protein
MMPSARHAVDAQVAASTQNQALAALVFLYAKVLNQPLERALCAAAEEAQLFVGYGTPRPTSQPVPFDQPALDTRRVGWLLVPFQATEAVVVTRVSAFACLIPDPSISAVAL